MRLILLLFLGMLLTGCYTSSLTTVAGPAAGIASGKVSETAASTSVNYMVKKQTGKAPLEHILSEKQIETLETNKAKINPCKQNIKLCSVLTKRIENTRRQLIGLNLQARIEKQHKKILKNPNEN